MFKNLRIRGKLAAVFSVVLAILIFVSGNSIFNLSQMAKNIDLFQHTAHRATVLAWTARRDIRLLEASIYQSITADDPQLIAKFNEQANASAKGYIDNLELLKDIISNQALIEDSLALVRQATPLREAVLAASTANDKDGALKLMSEQYLPVLEEIAGDLSQIGIESEALVETFVVNANKDARLSMLLIIGIGGIGLLVTLLGVTALINGLVRPLREIDTAAKAMSAGDLSGAVVYQSRDELGSVAQSMRLCMSTLQSYIADIDNVMKSMADGNFDVAPSQPFSGDFKSIENSISAFTGRISETLWKIHSIAEQVSGGADQLSNGAQALAQGATEQASSVEELSASIHGITAQVQQSAGHASQAAAMSTGATETVLSSNSEMQLLTASMEEISVNSNQIGKIIKTIEDIAFQTNILALNAAVEAARAGQSGKGFAVVADEVRSLAGKSAEAAKDTAALIQASIRSIGNGVQHTNETAKKMQDIVEGAKSTTAFITEISLATTAQFTSLSQISDGLGHISAVVQTNSATSEQSAAASEELSGQAQLLKSLVSGFRLRKDRIGSEATTKISLYSGRDSW